MNSFLGGFADELTKHAGVGLKLLGKGGRFAAKHPMLALSGLGTAAVAGVSAAKGYASGRAGSKARYLKAGVDEFGRAKASPAAYANYHRLFSHKPKPHEIKRLHEHYREKAFKR